MTHHSPTIILQRAAVFSICLLSLTPALAQFEYEVDGIEAGPLILRPAVDTSGAYDTRVMRSVTGEARQDLYAEGAASLELVNWPSRYALRISGRYGHRAYQDYTQLNDDFYRLAASLGTDSKPLIWQIASDYTKTLGYNLLYVPETGQQPDAILSDLSYTRLDTRANIAYDTQRFARTALVPSYTFRHYLHEYDTRSTDEWMVHSAILKLRYRYSAKADLYSGTVYSLQDRPEELGQISTLVMGIQHRSTEKTSWLAELGYAVADYERSGSDQGVVSNIRGNWRPMTKLSTYVFGGNNYQPGYSGSAARMVYRLGYGINWQFQKKVGFSASLLHDYQETIGNGNTTDPAYGTLRNFYDLKMKYDPTERLALVAGLRLNDDQYDTMQSIISLKMVYQFY